MRRPVHQPSSKDQQPRALGSASASPVRILKKADRDTFADAAVAAAEAVAAAAAAEVAGEAARTAQAAVDAACAAAAKAAARAQQVAADAAAVVAASAAVRQAGPGPLPGIGMSEWTDGAATSGVEPVTPLVQEAAEDAARRRAQAQRVARRVVVVAEAASMAARDAARVVAAQLHKDAAAAAEDVVSGRPVDDCVAEVPGAAHTGAAAVESARTEGDLADALHVPRSEVTSAPVPHDRLVEDLRRGLGNDELVVHFQPVIDLTDGRPVAAEALVRWQHPDKGLLAPAEFIVAAEDSGLIIEVGEVVLREACRAAARWAKAGGTRSTFHVAVNLSARQLTRGGLVDAVRRALTDSGAAPRNLVLEVTESAVMFDVDEAVHTLQELRALGVGIAIDDFGTGYSSLTYLKKFPVTTLKIDRSFVSGLGRDSDDAAIVTSVISLARAMGLDCIAEGVETEDQRLVLEVLGCGFGQGFLWSPAMDIEAFETWLGSAPPPRRATTRTPTVACAAVTATHPPAAGRQPGQPDVLGRVAELTTVGSSMTTIAAALNADQHLTPGGKRWTARTVGHLLAGLQPAPS